LHWAAYRGDAEAVRWLLGADAAPAVANRAGATPLSLACIAGDAEVIELLLDAGVDVNERLPNGETALMMAARTGRPESVELLLARGADVNAVENLRGTTPLMWAVAYEHPAIVALLIENGADVAARSKLAPRGRRPYLADTTRARLADFARGVGQAGRAIPVDLGRGPQGRPVSDEDLFGGDDDAAEPASPPAPPSGENVDAPPSDEDVEAPPRNGGPEQWGGLTPLVFAARQGALESTRLLLAGGADVNQTTEYGWTPLLAAIHNRYYGLALFLLQEGADPKLANKGGWSPLYLATDNRNIEGGDYPTRKADRDHLELIDALLARGADVNARMKSSTETRTIFTHQWLHEEGATPLLRAAQSGDVTLVKLYLENGADPNLTTEDGTTALMVAAGIGWVEGVTYEWSPEQTLETVRLLLDLGVPVNAQNLDGQTALMGAAHKGRNDVVQLLVDRGADLALRDIGSRDTIHVLAGVTWQAIDYADGLVRVGVQSAIPHPETAALLRELMIARGLPVPPVGRTLDSICVVDICK
ncbi:MAG TPA: ankyrin repeat domain-containing protein, partial [Gammaproteobacteria bacterium]|nr:ankyrin repeat domain-containing protein [Gammaproteobacteria bacterium]